MIFFALTCSKVRAFFIILVGTTIASTSLASEQIVALGHSAVDDQTVARNEMWPAVLEGMLHARGSQVHVTNAGVWGETTAGTLSRVSSAVPEGTRIVILMTNGFNDARKLNEGSANVEANIAAIKNQLKARGIKIIDAMGIYRSVKAQPGTAAADLMNPLIFK